MIASAVKDLTVRVMFENFAKIARTHAQFANITNIVYY